MKVICSWNLPGCLKIITPDDGMGGLDGHGCCVPCYEKALKELEEEDQARGGGSHALVYDHSTRGED